MQKTPAALTVAGLDPSGGAGILADVEAFLARGVHPLAAAAALTAQGAGGLRFLKPVPEDELAAQIAPLLEGFGLAAVKLGALGSAGNARRLAQLLRARPGLPVVLDPVLAASSGQALLDEAGRAALLEELAPLAALVTPNLDELFALTKRAASTDEREIVLAAGELLSLGAGAVLVKGGHASGPRAEDLLVTAAGVERFSSPRAALPPGLATARGTGCRLSAAIAAGLALGEGLSEAAAAAKAYLDGRFSAGVEERGGAGYFRPARG
jgi:hydroxymethylpyrimidine kinase/phosphomethylpyrimidine kinase